MRMLGALILKLSQHVGITARQSPLEHNSKEACKMLTYFANDTKTDAKKRKKNKPCRMLSQIELRFLALGRWNLLCGAYRKPSDSQVPWPPVRSANNSLHGHNMALKRRKCK